MYNYNYFKTKTNVIMKQENFIRFDWAAKRLLRQKSNFVVLEGFLSTLLNEDIKIERMLESEGNQDTFDDKFNRVDMLAENSKGELVIIEVQNTRELDFFHRMLYGATKAITEYISRGEKKEKVKKIYSINILYFGIGQGKDYVYHGRTEFRGIHTNDVLKLSEHQQQQFKCQKVGDLFPEYYVLRVDEFDKKAVTPLDEWISFLKTGDIPDRPKAKGLPEAKESLLISRLSKEEQRAYDAHYEAVRYQRSTILTGLIEGHMEGRAEGLKEGRAEGRAEGHAEGRAEGIVEGIADGERNKALSIARNALKMGMDKEAIIQLTGLNLNDLDGL
jgi:predicted transposase/invertase (TIGR01784 family)